ncbi:reverse transcriptase-like protein [Plakobranchus ocellatus]|uniref:Reverse transcriptase-like protein n=1 Tax=Plakobranchus ocellatus TaxID=259542 RepID=A0AAV4DQY5_9GAST|nr:reverse transcriptase-like protein [Plakobranchus ocellatus]
MNQLITVPTHRCGHTLDYLITSCSNSLILDHQVFDKAISDHFLIIADIDISKPKQEKRTVTSRNLKQLDTSVLKDMLKNCLSTTTVENADHLNQAMKTAIDHCAPVRTRTISARPISPWFSLEIKEAKRLRCQAERKWALLWLRSYLEYRTQSVQINNDRSDITVLKYGVPQGSVLGPILFTLYTQPIVKILTSHNFNYHFYADDSQIYIDGTIEDLSNLISNTQNCIEDIKTWMTNNKLKLNEETTEIILLGHPRFANDLQNVTINLSGHEITCEQTVKNLGVNIDQ